MKHKVTIGQQTVHLKSSESLGEVKRGSITLIVTSPPYWALKDYDHPDQIGQEPYEEYLQRLTTVWDECYRVSKENAILAVVVDGTRRQKRYYPIPMDIYRTMEKWKLIQVLVWYKPNALPQPNYYIDKLFANKHETILLFAKTFEYDYTFNKIRVDQKYAGTDPREHKMNVNGRCIGNVIRIPAYRPPNVKQMNYHVSAFPEELVYLLVSAFTDAGDAVLDPFLGSGTTLKVCESTGRVGVGYEVNEKFIDLIEARIQESWEPPPFKELDIIHSTKSEPPRHSQPPREQRHRKVSS